MDPSQAAQYHAMEKATAAEVLKNQEETTNSQHLQQNVAEFPAEVSVKSEMIPISTVTVHHAQSSPVVTHQSQHSFTLVSQVPNSPLPNSPGPAATTSTSPTYMESTTMTTISTQQTQVPHSPPVTVNNNMQSLFIEELHNASTRNRALSIEVFCAFQSRELYNINIILLILGLILRDQIIIIIINDLKSYVISLLEYTVSI